MTLSRRWVRGAVWVVLLMAGSVLARAQEVSGSISGTLVDAKGAGVSGAVVTLPQTHKAQIERTVKTNKAGFYSATSLFTGLLYTQKAFPSAVWPYSSYESLAISFGTDTSLTVNTWLAELVAIT